MSVTPPGMMIHVCCGHNEIITLHSAADLSYVMYQITVSIMHGHRLCVCNWSGHLKRSFCGKCNSQFSFLHKLW